MKNIYYISKGDNLQEHIINIENVCKAGIKLVQLRLKNITESDVFQIAILAKEICNQYDVELIINDYVNIAKKLGLGVHLGLGDTPILEAQKELKKLTIGGTANTVEDCLKLAKQGVSYIGLGPYRFTNTKKKLSPILGLEGYKKCLTALRNKGYKTPVYAIGGITLDDYKELMDVGVYGIAVSSLLSNKSPDVLKNIIKKLQNESVTNSR